MFLKDQDTPAQSRNTFSVTSNDANDEPRVSLILILRDKISNQDVSVCRYSEKREIK